MSCTPNYSIKLNQTLVDLSTPVVMGILNVTPDSFYKGNRFTSDKAILNRTETILKDGGKIIDVGGYSTRPDATQITRDEELRRVKDAVEIILKHFPDVLLSVDTFRAGVARELVKNYNIAIINDISGGTLDNLMFETVAELGVAYVLMHTRGTPQTMQTLTSYENVVSDVFSFLQNRIARLRLLGVNDIIVDPGFGFAKTMEQNFTLLRHLSTFQHLNVPVLAGLSRKSMLYKALNIEAADALNATTASNMLALTGGASILRVHDVKEAVETVTLFNYYSKG